MANQPHQRRGEVLLDKYRILDVLGRGGHAETFLVEDVQTGERSP